MTALPSLLEPLVATLPNLTRLTLSYFERSEAFLDGLDLLPLLDRLHRLDSLELRDVELEPGVWGWLERGAGNRLRQFTYKGNKGMILLHSSSCNS